MVDVNYVFLLSLSIIVIGFILKKLNIVTEEHGKVIAKIVFNVTLPAIILRVMSTLEINMALILIPLIMILFSLGVLVFALILFRNAPREKKGLILMTVIGFNVVHLAFPLVEGIWGAEGFMYIALVDMGNAITVFLICYLIGAIYSPKIESEGLEVNFKYIGKKLIKSTPLIAYIIGLSINFSGAILPDFVMDLLIILGRANTALTLLLLGIYLNFKFEKAEWGLIIKVLIIRYSIGLTVGLILFFYLPFNHIYRMIILIALILPVGLATIPFSVEFDYDERLINMMVTLTIIISFSLMWILVLILGV